MTRALTITATEWASVHDGTLWLVRPASLDAQCPKCRASYSQPMSGWRCPDHRPVPLPPTEFVQACAPCETCRDMRSVVHMFARQNGTSNAYPSSASPCPDCRIELVGPCPECGGWKPHPADSRGATHKFMCRQPSLTLGHAYAVGQPTPVVGWQAIWQRRNMIEVQGYRSVQRWDDHGERTEDLTDRLAYYGPPESLVGKWALQLAVRP